MNYISTKQYSDKIKSLMEDDSPMEEKVPIKGTKTMRERISEMSPDDKKKLQEYISAIKEIKSEIEKLLHKDSIEEGGDMMNLILKPEE